MVINVRTDEALKGASFSGPANNSQAEIYIIDFYYLTFFALHEITNCFFFEVVMIEKGKNKVVFIQGASYWFVLNQLALFLSKIDN